MELYWFWQLLLLWKPKDTNHNNHTIHTTVMKWCGPFILNKIVFVIYGTHYSYKDEFIWKKGWLLILGGWLVGMISLFTFDLELILTSAVMDIGDEGHKLYHWRWNECGPFIPNKVVLVIYGTHTNTKMNSWWKRDGCLFWVHGRVVFPFDLELILASMLHLLTLWNGLILVIGQFYCVLRNKINKLLTISSYFITV